MEQDPQGHKCPDQVPLHVIEELIEVLQLNDAPAEDGEAGASSDESDLMFLRAPTNVPKSSNRTLRLHGFIGKRHVLIFVDSGSDSSFINADLVEELHCVT